MVTAKVKEKTNEAIRYGDHEEKAKAKTNEAIGCGDHKARAKAKRNEGKENGDVEVFEGDKKKGKMGKM